MIGISVIGEQRGSIGRYSAIFGYSSFDQFMEENCQLFRDGNVLHLLKEIKVRKARNEGRQLPYVGRTPWATTRRSRAPEGLWKAIHDFSH
ncbi:hypothetical protein CTEST_00085 [Corynebacterium testudinoris]|uniref:Uncharacterized protein n=1 Tax=Corynebacterium testudinoris TaxID=136857 RepID=A0A0G3H6L8_9CORY|nr:hypothetical protein CTEST_00085 [Corynebacterium testudinoris]